MTITLTRSMLRDKIADAYGERLNLGDRALELAFDVGRVQASTAVVDDEILEDVGAAGVTVDFHHHDMGGIGPRQVGTAPPLVIGHRPTLGGPDERGFRTGFHAWR